MLVQVKETNGRFLIPIPDEIAEKFGVGAGSLVDIVWESGNFIVSHIDEPSKDSDEVR